MWWLSIALAEPIGEVWVHAPAAVDHRALEALGLNFAEGRQGDWVLMHGYEAALDAAEAGWSTRDRRTNHARLDRAEGYRTPGEIDLWLRELGATDSRVDYAQIGESVEGRPIGALRLGTPGSPVWRILGAHHGDELSSSELALATIEALLAGEGPWAGLLADREVWVVPAVNPDGMVAGSRTNANDVDLNRNYGWEWSESVFSGARPFSEPETQAVAALSSWIPFHAGLSLHSGEINVGYPWNNTQTNGPDEARLLDLSEAYAQACSVPGFWVTNGAAWYITYGDTNDWSYGVHGVFDLTVEISETKTPAAPDLESFLQAHLPAVAAMLARPVDLRGSVVDASTGRPIQAEVELTGGGRLLSDPVTGRFDRQQETGVWPMEVLAPGYRSVFGEVRIEAGQIERVQVALEPELLHAEARVEPAVLPYGEELELRLRETDERPRRAWLTRPGHEPVELLRDGEVYPVDTRALSEGTWTFESDELVVPRALFVAGEGHTAAVQAVARLQAGLLVTGWGFADGTRVWALHGPDRALEPVPVVDESGEHLLLNDAAIPGDGTVDLLIWSKGRQLAIADVNGVPQIDPSAQRSTETQDTDTAAQAWAEGDLLGYRGGCTTTPSGPFLWAWLLLLARRRPNA